MKPRLTPDDRTDIDVKDESLFIDFYEDRELAERTIKLYRIHLNKYCNYIGAELEDLLDLYESEEKTDIIERKRKINVHLKRYRKYLKDAGYSETTIKMFIISVRAFFGQYKITMDKPRRKLSRKARKRKVTKSVEVLPKLEEIQQFMDSLNEVYRVVLLFGISSGMGSAEIGSLTYKHLYEACEIEPYPQSLPELIRILKNKGHFIPTWHVERIKTGVPYFTFTSPELMKHLIIYLELYAKKYPEYIPKPEDNLLRSLKKVGYYGKSCPITAQVIAKRFYYTNEKYGFRKEKGQYVLVSHGFRKYFASTLEKSKMPHITTRKLMGHDITGTQGSYFFTDIEDAKADYLEVVNALSTDKVEVQQVNIFKDLESLKIDMDDLKKRI